MCRNSSIPYFECSRPMPECLMPPKGATSDVMPTSFTPTMPNSRASATFQLRFRSCRALAGMSTTAHLYILSVSGQDTVPHASTRCTLEVMLTSSILVMLYLGEALQFCSWSCNSSTMHH